MKIGLIFDHFEETRGGAEHSLALLFRELAQRGHEVKVYCQSGTAPHPQIEVVPVEVSGSRAARERKFAEKAVAAARSAGCLVFGVRHLLEADVYQPHGGTWAATQEVRRGLEEPGMKSRLGKWTRALSGKHKYFEEADRLIFERNPQMLTLAVSGWVKRDIEQRYGAAKPRVEVVSPGVDLQRFHPGLRKGAGLTFRRRMGIQANTPLALFVGHDYELKGLETLLQAWPKTKPGRKLGHLLVAGRGDVDAARQRAEQLDLKGRSWWLADRGDMAELYGAADVLVQPTLYDPCSLATLEAMATGVPVVTSACNGASELIGEAGLTVDDPRDVDGFVEAINAVMGERDRFAEAARPTAEPFTQAAMADRVESLLGDLAPGGQRG